MARALGGRRVRTTTCTTWRGTPRIWTSARYGTAANTRLPLSADTVSKDSNESGFRSEVVKPAGSAAATLGVAGSKNSPSARTASTAEPSRRSGDLRASSTERRARAGSVRLSASASCWTVVARPCASLTSSRRVWISVLCTARARLARPDNTKAPRTISTMAAVIRRRTLSPVGNRRPTRSSAASRRPASS